MGRLPYLLMIMYNVKKTQFMTKEHGPAIEVMRQLKQTLDPHGILNLGKVLP